LILSMTVYTITDVVGDAVGTAVGLVGATVVGVSVGLATGDVVGRAVGASVGIAVGAVGPTVGANVGLAVGAVGGGGPVRGLMHLACSVMKVPGIVFALNFQQSQARRTTMPYTAAGSGVLVIPSFVSCTLMVDEPSVTTTCTVRKYGVLNPPSTKGLTLLNTRAPCTSTLNERAVADWCQLSTISSWISYAPLPLIGMS
jgi:hypothetical protein